MATAHKLDCESVSADCRFIVQSENETEALGLARQHVNNPGLKGRGIRLDRRWKTSTARKVRTKNSARTTCKPSNAEAIGRTDRRIFSGRYRFPRFHALALPGDHRNLVSWPSRNGRQQVEFGAGH